MMKTPFVVTIQINLECPDEKASEEIIKTSIDRMVEIARKGDHILPPEVLEIDCFEVKKWERREDEDKK